MNTRQLRPGRVRNPNGVFASTEGAVVIGGDYRALGIVRSLGRRGVPVWVLTDQHLVAGTSRYARKSKPWPDGTDDARVDYLSCLARSQGLTGWTIFPSSDEAAAFLARHSSELEEHFRLTVSSWDRIRWAYDKRLSYQIAERVGVAQPRTYFPSSRADVEELECIFPVILKPAVKTKSNDFTQAKAWRVDDAGQLATKYELVCTLVDPEIVMIQELIPGDGSSQVSFAALCENGQPLAWISAQRTRQYPMDFGRFSTCVESVELPVVEESARTLIKEIKFTGLIEVEFKYDSRDHQYKFLDMNPRAWGWHSLAQRAGVDFPYLTWLMSRGSRVHTTIGRSDVRWVRELADIPVAAKEIWRGNLSPKGYLRSIRPPVELAMFARDDPMPAICDIPIMITQMLRRRTK